jgi:hypothetical protein
MCGLFACHAGIQFSAIGCWVADCHVMYDNDAPELTPQRLVLRLPDAPVSGRVTHTVNSTELMR